MDKVITDCVEVGRVIRLMDEMCMPSYCVIGNPALDELYRHLRGWGPLPGNDPFPLSQMFPQHKAFGRDHVEAVCNWDLWFCATIVSGIARCIEQDHPWVLNFSDKTFFTNLLICPHIVDETYDWIWENGDATWNEHLSATDTDDAQALSKA